MNDEGWEERMAQRARERRPPPVRGLDRSSWPVPDEIKGHSARDVLLWYICDGWRRVFNADDEPIETVMDHDFGLHVLRKGKWQLTLVDVEEFPEHDYLRESDREEGRTA